MTAIPASIPPPQAVVELINSHCPPSFSVSSVGTSVSLYRGASKTPLAAFSYTGPDSVIGVTVAIWRIALAEKAQPVTNITNVSNSLAAADIEEMKARGDALEILGWPGACDPTAWARSYLNIEQVTLAEARQEAALAAEKLRTSETVRSSVSADLEQIWAAFTVAEGRDEPASASSIAEFILAQEGAKEALKAALAAEDKERARAEKAKSRIRILESEATALRDSEQRAVDASVEARVALKSLGWDEVQHPIQVWARQRADSLAKGLREAREAAEQGTTRIVELSAEVGTVQAQNKALLAGLWKLSYHPDMDLDEWVAARVKQRDQTEGKLEAAHKALMLLGWLPALSIEPILWAESKRAELDGAERELADLQRLLAAAQGGPRVSEEPEDLLTLGPRLRAMGPALRKLRLDHAVPLRHAPRRDQGPLPDPRRQGCPSSRVASLLSSMRSHSGSRLSSIAASIGTLASVARARSVIWVEAPARSEQAKPVGPRWTGITWMSKKGRAKTCRIEGLTIGRSDLALVEAGPVIEIKVPTSPWNLPAKLVCRIHGKKTLSFHVGGGKVITGTVAKVDASAISSMLLYVAT